MGGFLEPGGCGVLAAEEADGAAADLFVAGTGGELEVAVEGLAFVQGEGEEVVGEQLDGAGFAEEGDGAGGGGGSLLKVWSGAAWVEKPAKVWTGSAWVEKPAKVWSGSAWV